MKQWMATSPHETIEVLEAELHQIGIHDQEKQHRAILFDCDLETAYRAHYQLRTASRLQRIISKFDVNDLHELETNLKSIHWPDWLRHHKGFIIRPVLSDDDALALGEESVINSFVSSIQNAPFEKHPPKYTPDADNPITLVPFVRNNTCVLSVDTAGKALHKRGWRVNGHPAVLKETLAATILMMAGYDGSETLLDPMCGSGTVAIEAAYIALNKAPLIHRSKDEFALEHLANFDRQLWRKIGDQLRAKKKQDLDQPIYASDINEKFVEVAQKGALRARVEKYMNFQTNSFLDLDPPTDSGLLITNLPYGERIGKEYLNSLYSSVGKILKEKYSNWRIALLVPVKAPIHLLDFKASKEYRLSNGALPVKLLVKN